MIFRKIASFAPIFLAKVPWFYYGTLVFKIQLLHIPYKKGKIDQNELQTSEIKHPAHFIKFQLHQNCTNCTMIVPKQRTKHFKF